MLFLFVFLFTKKLVRYVVSFQKLKYGCLTKEHSMKFKQKALGEEKKQVLISYEKKDSNTLVYTSSTYQISKCRCTTRVKYIKYENIDLHSYTAHDETRNAWTLERCTSFYHKSSRLFLQKGSHLKLSKP